LYLPRLATPALTPPGGFADSTAMLRQKENVETLPATSPTKNPEAGIVPAQHLTKTAFPVSISRTVAIMRAPCGEMDIITNPMEYTMNRRTLHLDLLHSGKYRQHIVKAKKGKGAFSRHEKHKKHHRDPGGVFLCPLFRLC
jgi:domain of unknown function